MSLSQPSRTIVVEPVQAPRTAPPPPREPSRPEVEAPTAPEEPAVKP